MKKLEERFMDKVSPEPMSGCWLWLGFTNPKGYGRFRIEGKNGPVGQAHRVAYELFRGPIPSGLTLDHLCRVRSCVNPAHVEPVTAVENVRRGGNVQKPHCPQGHPLSGDNLSLRSGQRSCRICNRAAGLRWRRNHGIEAR